MAVVVEQKPNERLLPAYKDNIIILSDYYADYPLYSSFKYKMKISIFMNDGTFTNIILKASPNDNAMGIFNISSVVQDFCKTDIASYAASVLSTTLPIHKIPQYSRNIDNLKRVIVYGTSEANNVLTNTGVEQLSSYTLVGDVTGYRIWNGCSEHENGLTFNYTPYILDGTSKKLLTGLPNAVNRKARSTDYGVIAFFRGKFVDFDNTTNTSDADTIRIKFYDSSDTLLSNILMDNTNAAGGTSSNFTNPHALGLIYFGAYPKNLQDNPDVAYPANTSYYTIGVEESDTTQISLTYTFEIQDEDCKGFETIRLGYINRLGTWDYYNFTKKSTRETAIQRSNTKTTYGTWNSDTYDYGTFEGGLGSYNVIATETIDANSDFINEDEASALEELFTSPSVVMQNTRGNFEPVTILEQSYVKQTTANDMLKQYAIKIQKSHNKRIQRT